MEEGRAEFLRKLPVFRMLSAEGAEKLAASCEVASFAPGTHILRKGDPGESMFVLTQGSVQVVLLGEDGRRVAVYLGPGDFFGEMALFTGDPRRADVVADGEVEVKCLVLHRETVGALLKEEPRIARFLTEILGKRLMSGGHMRAVGKYQLMGELGRGGGAIVYEGYHPGLDRSVAVKMLAHDLVYEGDFVDRFVHEAQLIADLRHENIVQVYDIERAYATFFIVMERLDGTELKNLISEGPASPEETRHTLRQVARALQYAHNKKIVHQDVKPSNIFVEDTGRVRLMDFGIAGVAEHRSDEGAGGGVMGTPGYIAPEQMYGGPVDGRADIYALGVVGYEMMTGKLAFDQHSKVDVLREQLACDCLELSSDVATRCPDLAAFVRKATAKSPHQRFRNCADVLEHLDEPSDRLDPSRAESMVLSVMFDRRDRDRVKDILDEASESLGAIPGARLALADLLAKDN